MAQKSAQYAGNFSDIPDRVRAKVSFEELDDLKPVSKEMLEFRSTPRLDNDLDDNDLDVVNAAASASDDDGSGSVFSIGRLR